MDSRSTADKGCQTVLSEIVRASSEKASFNALPTDLKAYIIEHVARPSDLKRICLVSHELHELAIRPLYHEVAIGITGGSDLHLAAFLHPRNKGLAHVRRLRLNLGRARDRSGGSQMTAFATRMLLEFLPEDQLEEVRCASDDLRQVGRNMPADTLLHLYRKQKRMKRLELTDLDRNILPELKSDPRLLGHMFDCARELALYPGSREMLSLGGLFVEKMADKLENLTIFARLHSDDDDSPPRHRNLEIRDFNDSSTGPGLLTMKTFAHLLPFESCTPLKNLTSLRLRGFSLRYCADTWCKFVDFVNVRSLSISYCSGADSLLGQLSKPAHLPRALKVLEVQHVDSRDDEALHALDGLLCLVSGIEYLTIDLQCVSSLPRSAGIARHGKTLQTLNVHGSKDTDNFNFDQMTSVSHGEELVFEKAEFDKICTACTKLEQLSCAWPDMCFIRTSSPGFCSFEKAISENLRKLVTLHITTFPKSASSNSRIPRTAYETLLQSLALRIFDRVAGFLPYPLETLTQPPSPSSSDSSSSSADGPSLTELLACLEDAGKTHGKLRLIAFGIASKAAKRRNSKNLIAYLRSTCVDAEGKEQRYAAPVNLKACRHLEPRSTVLDFPLNREVEIPYQNDSGRSDPFSVPMPPVVDLIIEQEHWANM